MNPELIAEMAQRQLETETAYKDYERGYTMTPEQVAEMNATLGLTKTADYRPYCLHADCRRMPRMYVTPLGFACWSCNNRIGFNLKP